MKISQLEVSNIRFGKLEDNLRTPSQKIAFISYERDRTPLNAITPEFITETYGIPREGPFYQTVKSRAFYKLPFCHERKQYPEDIDYDSVAGSTTSSRRSTSGAAPRTSGSRSLGRSWLGNTSISPL